MQSIINLELPGDSLIWHCKNYFLFSYYCAGIRAADLIQLRWRNVTTSGKLHYWMCKNHKERGLLLVEPAVKSTSTAPTSTPSYSSGLANNLNSSAYRVISSFIS